MIKRLRKKFILTNMLLVALVLIIVFGVLVGYNYQRLVRQSEEAMRTALKWSDDAPPPVFQFGASHEEEMEEQGEERRFTMVPVFVVLLDEDGGGAFDLKDGTSSSEPGGHTSCMRRGWMYSGASKRADPFVGCTGKTRANPPAASKRASKTMEWRGMP